MTMMVGDDDGEEAFLLGLDISMLIRCKNILNKFDCFSCDKMKGNLVSFKLFLSYGPFSRIFSVNI